MKLITLLTLAILPLHAAELERFFPSHLGLSASLIANSASQEDHFRTTWGSSDIHTEKSRTVTAGVRNFGAEAVETEITVFWIGKYTGGNDRLLLKREAAAHRIAPGATGGIISESGSVTGSELKLVTIGVQRARGERIEGWVVTVRDAGTKALLACKGSDSHLEDLARTTGAIAALPQLETTPAPAKADGTAALPVESVPKKSVAAEVLDLRPAGAAAAGQHDLRLIVTMVDDDRFTGELPDGELVHVNTAMPPQKGATVVVRVRPTGGMMDTVVRGEARRIVGYEQVK